MKYLIVLLLFFSLPGYSQTATVALDFTPSHPVADFNQVMIEAGYLHCLHGNDCQRIGAFIKTDNGFDQCIVGITLQPTLLKIGEMSSFDFIGSWGVDLDKTNEDKWGEEHYRHYIEVGALFSYKLDDIISLSYYFKYQYWGDYTPLVSGIRISADL